MNQVHLNSQDSECRQGLLSSALAITMLTGLTFLVALTISHIFQSTTPTDLSEFIAPVTFVFHPEPTERKTFQIMLLLAPLIALLSHAIVMRLSPSFVSSLFFGNRGYVIVALLMLAWVNSWAFCPNFMSSSGLGSFSFILPIVTGVVLIIYAYSHHTPISWMNTLIKKRFALILTLVLGICFFIAVSFRIFDWKVLVENVDHDEAIHHMNPVLYYANLAETGSYTTNLGAPQYGFYSLYLKPVFSMLGLTIYSFSFVMTLLYLLGVIAIAVPIYRHLQNPYLKLLLVPVLCALQGALSQAAYMWNPYFQYYPIRFLVPSLSVLMLYLMLKTRKENTRLCFAGLSSLMLGFLVFWNFDSGITTIIAWLGFFLLFAIVETMKRRTLFNPASSSCLVVAVMLALGVGGAAIILITCDQSWISSGRLFEIQKIFYLKGFCMMPMPLILHPWMSVIGVYMATLVLTFPVLLNSGLQSSPKRMLAFYIAILGFGLFAYYQGRSHDMNLPTAAWPAILCCFLACDWCLSADSAKRRSAIRFLSLPFMVLAVSLTVRLVWNSPWYLDKMALLHQKITTTELNSGTMPVTYTFDWLSEYQNEPLGSVLIISPAESVYYAESGLHPLPLLPSEQERFLFRRQEVDMQKIIQSGTIRHLFISPTLKQKPQYKKIYETILALYQLEETFLLEHWTLKEQFPKKIKAAPRVGELTQRRSNRSSSE